MLYGAVPTNDMKWWVDCRQLTPLLHLLHLCPDCSFVSALCYSYWTAISWLSSSYASAGNYQGMLLVVVIWEQCYSSTWLCDLIDVFCLLQVMVSLAGHLQSIESEKQKLRSQVRRLCQENAWLRDELADTQQRLQQSEQRCVTLDEERTHLQFMNDMRKYDSESTHQVIHLQYLHCGCCCCCLCCYSTATNTAAAAAATLVLV